MKRISDKFMRNVKHRPVYLCMYINSSCICKNNTVNHLEIGQQLFGLTG